MLWESFIFHFCQHQNLRWGLPLKTQVVLPQFSYYWNFLNIKTFYGFICREPGYPTWPDGVLLSSSMCLWNGSICILSFNPNSHLMTAKELIHILLTWTQSWICRYLLFECFSVKYVEEIWTHFLTTELTMWKYSPALHLRHSVQWSYNIPVF